MAKKYLQDRGLLPLSVNNTNAHDTLPSAPSYPSDSEDVDESESELELGIDPIIALPYIKINEQHINWPKRLRRLFGLARTSPLQDAAFLTILALLPFSVAPKMFMRYNGINYHPNPMLLFSAPPASGKGILGELFHLLDVEDQRRRSVYEKEKAEYDKKRSEMSQLGKAKADVEIPKEPALYFAKVSADNTTSGLTQNISDSKGHCALVDSEMYILAQSAEKKGFGDPTVNLCKAWSHEDISMNRRSNNENIYVKSPLVTMVMTGTPSQILALVKSPENGFFTRVMYYHIPIDTRWLSATVDVCGEENEGYVPSIRHQIISFAEEWEALLHERFDKVNNIRFVLSREQLSTLNRHLFLLNVRAAASNNDMVSYVHRMGPNILRLCMSLALVRALEPEDSNSSLLVPRKGTNPDNIKDNICPQLDLFITDDDFYTMVNMLQTLYLHAAHALSLLKQGKLSSTHISDRDIFFSEMSDTFTIDLAKSCAETLNVSRRTASNWIADFIKAGKLERVDKGVYKKTRTIKDTE